MLRFFINISIILFIIKTIFSILIHVMLLPEFINYESKSSISLDNKNKS